MIRHWFKSGSPWIWLTASAVSVNMILVFGLLVFIAIRGLGHFWPSEVVALDYVGADGAKVSLIGEINDQEKVTVARLHDAGVDVPGNSGDLVTRYLIKTGNRDVSGADFRWIVAPNIQARHVPKTLVTLERREWGNFYGELLAVRENGKLVSDGKAAWDALQERLQRANNIFDDIRVVEKSDIGSINYGLERIRLKERKLELDKDEDPAKHAALAKQRAELQAKYEGLQTRLRNLYQSINRDSMDMVIADGRTIEIPLAKVVRAYRPNSMSLMEKIGFYMAKVWEFVSDEPREANTEGGIFPAIFGTVMMVIIMSIMVVPFGVVAAVYLREYAKQGPLTRLIRIAVNNLAGVPSIVYGVFGLGFFVYFLGGNIDQLFFPAVAVSQVPGKRLPSQATAAGRSAITRGWPWVASSPFSMSARYGASNCRPWVLWPSRSPSTSISATTFDLSFSMPARSSRAVAKLVSASAP